MRAARSLLAALVALAALAPTAAPAAAARPATFAGSLGLAVPRGAQGEVRAISRVDASVVAARTVGRSGRFRLSLPPGAYAVVGTVVPRRGRRAPSQRVLGVSLAAGQRRTRASLKARRRAKAKRRRARTAFVQERGQVTPGRIAVEIPRFTGATGDLAVLNKGLAEMLITDLVADSDCDVAVREVERIDDVVRELTYQQSPYFDPGTRGSRNFIVSDVAVRGTLTGGTGDRSLGYDIRIVDTRTGAELGRLRGSLSLTEGVFAGEERLAGQLNEELCKLTDVYEVRLGVRGTGRFATHEASGTLASSIDARRGSGADEKVWRGQGTLSWGELAFISKTPPCIYTDPVPGNQPWTVTITDAGRGSLRVTWETGGVGPAATSTASIDCPPEGDPPVDPPPIPGQPGTSLIATAPTTFTVPYAGGTQPISGQVSEGGDGFFNSGTITVTPKGVARKRG